jgi:hypothetical protein
MEIVEFQARRGEVSGAQDHCGQGPLQGGRGQGRHSLVRHRLHSLPGKQRRFSTPISATAIRSVASTVNVPKGRGPFGSWEDGAYDALVTVENLDDIPMDRPRMLRLRLRENQRLWLSQSRPQRIFRSPYLWGGTNLQKPGKFVSRWPSMIQA